LAVQTLFPQLTGWRALSSIFAANKGPSSAGLESSLIHPAQSNPNPSGKTGEIAVKLVKFPYHILNILTAQAISIGPKFTYFNF